VEKVKTGTETILFVENDMHIVKLSEQILAKLGYRTITETNPEKAFKNRGDNAKSRIIPLEEPFFHCFIFLNN